MSAVWIFVGFLTWVVLTIICFAGMYTTIPTWAPPSQPDTKKEGA